MKKLLPILAILLLVPALAAVDVTRTTTVGKPGMSQQMTLSIAPTEATSGFSLADLIPLGWSISSWDISGFDKGDITFAKEASRTFQGKTYTGYSWEFKKAFSAPVTITYSIVPPTEGSFVFTAVWVYPGGFNKADSTLSVSSAPTPVGPTCGNAACESGETCGSCSVDCGSCPPAGPSCGNRACESGETCGSCPTDCGACATQPKEDLTSGLVSVILLVIIAAILMVLFLSKKQPSKEEQPQPPAEPPTE